MSKQLLIETRMNSLSLKEGVEKSQKKGCLGTIEGPCADYKNPTRNDNFYSRKLWENAFNNEITKECLKDRILIGELDHPSDRLETKATEACIVMTNYEFHDDEGLLYGTFDILDTPRGRILKSLLDYGCKIGVSSRGEGDVEECEGINRVDEDNFEFVAFDAVALPAVKAAKPALQESLNRDKVMTLKESLEKEVASATTPAELSLIKSVVEATNMPDADSLLESVKNKYKELSAVTTGSSEVLKDLERATDEISSLREELDLSKRDLTTCKSRYSRQLKSRQKLITEVSSLKKEVESLTKKYNSLIFESNMSSKSKKDTDRQLEESLLRESSLKKDNSSLSSQLKSSQSECAKLRESVETMQTSYQQKSREVSDLKSQVKTLQNESSRKLEESTRRCQTEKKRSQKMTEDLSLFKRSYVEETCLRNRIDPQKILGKVTGESSKKDIDKLVQEEMNRNERYSSVPIVKDSLVDLLESSTVRVSSPSFCREDEESSRTYQFMEETSKLF